MLSAGKNLAVALVSICAFTFFAVVYDAYASEIASAPLLYRSIWYMLLAGSGFVFVGTIIAAATKRRF